MSKKELVVGTSLVERPIAMLVQTAGRYASELHLQMDNKNINKTNINWDILTHEKLRF